MSSSVGLLKDDKVNFLNPPLSPQNIYREKSTIQERFVDNGYFENLIRHIIKMTVFIKNMYIFISWKEKKVNLRFFVKRDFQMCGKYRYYRVPTYDTEVEKNWESYNVFYKMIYLIDSLWIIRLMTNNRNLRAVESSRTTQNDIKFVIMAYSLIFL